MMKNIVFWINFITAVILAAAHTAWHSAKLHLWALTRAVSNYRKNGQDANIARLSQWRMARCRKCPIYYAPLQTCGSPLQRNPIRLPNGRRAGCFCYLPMKTADPYAECWAFEEYNNLALPDNLIHVLQPYMWISHEPE